jgi:S1-C subfamily serine protease
MMNYGDFDTMLRHSRIGRAVKLANLTGALLLTMPVVGQVAAPRKTALPVGVPPPPGFVYDAPPKQVVLTTAQVATKISPSVVVIQGKTTSGDALGSGFIVSKDGKIVTNLHVVRDMKTATVQTAKGEVFDSVSVVGIDERRDLAVLQIAGFNLPVLELGDSDVVTVGEPLVIVGSPRGLEGTVTSGILSSVRDSGEGFTVLQTDAAVNPGNSGGPLANSRGQAIGVVSSKVRSAENLNFAIPINYVRGLLSSLHGPLTLDQMRLTLNAATPIQADSGPTLKETLDWLKEKIPLGAAAWVQSSRDGTTSRATHQGQAWSMNSCTIAVGYVDVITFDIPPLQAEKLVITDRFTLPLSDMTRAFVTFMDNVSPQYKFVSGDRSSYVVMMVSSSAFVHVTNTNNSQLPPKSERANSLFLPFNDEGLANRVKTAFEHAADLCRKKEAF